MSNGPSESDQPGAPGCSAPKAHCALLGAVCALVIGVYAWCAQSGWIEAWGLNAQNTYYNLLVQGFRAGQLNLKRDVPAGLAQLANPYDPKAMTPFLVVKYPLLDQSYYQGKLYLYFGVTPALVLFWPYAALTGHFLLHKHAVAIFFSVGFLAGAGLLCALWRRYFPSVSVRVVAAGTLALGIVNFAPVILRRCDVYEVAISCGYALTMVTLLLLWQAIHATRGRAWWLAGSSLAYGLALGARPSLLSGALILLLPLAGPGREGAELRPPPPSWTLWLAATAPIALIGLGLMLYNALRFGDPLEFGQTYQLTLDRASALQQFSPRFLWFNFRVSFLAPARWSGHFPFVRDIALPPLPDAGVAEQLPFGILTNIPLVWLAVAAPLAWRCRLARTRSALRGFLGAVALLFAAGALTLSLHNSMTLRYQLEFASPLVLLAVVGVLALERLLAPRSLGRLAARCVWGLLLACSLAFILFAAFARSVEPCIFLGNFFTQEGRPELALVEYQKALMLEPDNAKAHSGLGVARFQQGNLLDAIRLQEQALRLQPDFAEAHFNLGAYLFQLGNLPEAVAHYQQALRLQPDFLKAHNNLAAALFQQGRVLDAIAQLQALLQLNPGDPVAHFNLGKALVQSGRLADAAAHFEQALRLQPAFAQAQHKLAWLLATSPDPSLRNGARAVALAEEAYQAAGGNDVAILDTLAAAYAQAGRFADAVRTAQKAVALVQADGPAEAAQPIQARLQCYQASRPYHEESSLGP